MVHSVRTVKGRLNEHAAAGVEKQTAVGGSRDDGGTEGAATQVLTDQTALATIHELVDLAVVAPQESRPLDKSRD